MIWSSVIVDVTKNLSSRIHNKKNQMSDTIIVHFRWKHSPITLDVYPKNQKKKLIIHEEKKTNKQLIMMSLKYYNQKTVWTEMLVDETNKWSWWMYIRGTIWKIWSWMIIAETNVWSRSWCTLNIRWMLWS